MKRLIKYSIVSFAVCLCLSLGAMPKGPKPYSIKGHSEGKVVEVAPDGSWIKTDEIDIGESNFFGRHYNVMHGTYYTNGTSELYGTFLSANRKGTLEWVATNGVITITNGTGLYVGITGGHISVATNFEIDPVTRTLHYDYTGAGVFDFPPKSSLPEPTSSRLQTSE